MNTQRIDKRLSPSEYAALTDAARRRALQARREAIEEFWTALGRGIVSAWRALRRPRAHAATAPACNLSPHRR